MIRTAEFADRIAMVRMARAFIQESGLDLPFDAAWVEHSAKTWIADPDKLALVLDVDGVKGMFCAAWIASPLSPVRVAMEQVFWIDPSIRGAASLKWANRFLEAYETWAREQGCAHAGLATLEGQRTGAIYARKGYTVAEHHYSKVL